MKSTATALATALAIPLVAVLGGGFAVFAAYDDAPGGVLIGGAMALGAMVVAGRGAWRRGK